VSGTEGSAPSNQAARTPPLPAGPERDGEAEPSREEDPDQRPDGPSRPGGPQQGRWGWIRQFLKFVTVGLSSTAVELIVYNSLLQIGNPHNLQILTVYSTLGVVAAIVNSYAWNSRWAFKQARVHGGRRAMRQRALFLTQSLVNVGINDAVTIVVTPPLTGLDLLPLTVSQNLAKAVAMSTSSVSSYLMLRRFVFAAARSPRA
jgi:putative flippase GtrA